MPILHVQLLGECRLICDEQEVVAINRPRLQLLLAYLLLKPNVVHSRQHLAFLLWPDTPDAQARSNLRTLLHRLRDALPEADMFLYTDIHTVRWCPKAPYTFDVSDFQDAIVQAQTSVEHQDWAAARHALAQAVELYRDDLLLGRYEDWILHERERLKAAFFRALEELIALLAEAKEYAAAIDYAERLLRADPLREPTYRHLMHLHELNGDRASAVRVYQRCTVVLERELALKPSPTTQAVYEHLLHSQASSSEKIVDESLHAPLGVGGIDGSVPRPSRF